MAKPAYTYVVVWLEHDVYYYGFKSHAIGTKPSDSLWVTYFTSSKYVAQFREQYGEPDVVEVDKVFDTIRAAKEYETWYLRTVADIHSPRWLNKADGAGGFCHDVPHSDSAKAKMSAAKLGKAPPNKGVIGVVKQTPESIAKRVAKTTGQRRTQATKDAIGAANKGKTRSDETKARLKEAKARLIASPDYVAPNKRRTFSAEWKENLSKARLGSIPWNAGRTGVQVVSEETRRKLSEKVKQSWAKRKAQKIEGELN